MNSFPEFNRLTFIQNPNRSDIYDIKTPGFNKFKYFRLSEPRNGWMKSQGASYVIETWIEGSKALFSGLIPFKDNIYYGDNKNPKTGRKSFIIAILDGDTITINYFNSFSLYPKERPKFLARFTHTFQLTNPDNETYSRY